mmetsp:Transcript_74066/g.203945  ORF Transcript_74066/g.203945 Transcript_74066/m.203945 type:complete len:252 (+) Transcript_74066:260-1015(+)
MRRRAPPPPRCAVSKRAATPGARACARTTRHPRSPHAARSLRRARSRLGLCGYLDVVRDEELRRVEGDGHEDEREDEVQRRDRANVCAVDTDELLEGTVRGVVGDWLPPQPAERLLFDLRRELKEGDEERGADGGAARDVHRELAADRRRDVLHVAAKVAARGAVGKAKDGRGDDVDVRAVLLEVTPKGHGRVLLQLCERVAHVRELLHRDAPRHIKLRLAALHTGALPDCLSNRQSTIGVHLARDRSLEL